MALALTDAQLQTIRECAGPFPRFLRDQHLQEIARRLAGTEVGDGSVHAAATETAGGVAREGVMSCPRAGCGKSACPVR